LEGRKSRIALGNLCISIWEWDVDVCRCGAEFEECARAVGGIDVGCDLDGDIQDEFDDQD
jgi:hypothetical protein